MAVTVMAGGGPPSTSLLITAGKDVDTDLRRHDDLPGTRGASCSWYKAAPSREGREHRRSEAQHGIGAEGEGVVVLLGVEGPVVGEGMVPADFGPDREAGDRSRHLGLPGYAERQRAVGR